jgi:excisionase family DNA binding protein
MPTKKQLSVIPAVESPTFVITPRGYRIEDAAIYMGLTPWFLEEEIRAKRLPALHICRHYTILKEDMDEYLTQARGKAA